LKFTEQGFLCADHSLGVEYEEARKDAFAKIKAYLDSRETLTDKDVKDFEKIIKMTHLVQQRAHLMPAVVKTYTSRYENMHWFWRFLSRINPFHHHHHGQRGVKRANKFAKAYQAEVPLELKKALPRVIEKCFNALRDEETGNMRSMRNENIAGVFADYLAELNQQNELLYARELKSEGGNLHNHSLRTYLLKAMGGMRQEHTKAQEDLFTLSREDGANLHIDIPAVVPEIPREETETSRQVSLSIQDYYDTHCLLDLATGTEGPSADNVISFGFFKPRITDDGLKGLTKSERKERQQEVYSHAQSAGVI